MTDGMFCVKIEPGCTEPAQGMVHNMINFGELNQLSKAIQDSLTEAFRKKGSSGQNGVKFCFVFILQLTLKYFRCG